jgi:hypothetical protein
MDQYRWHIRKVLKSLYRRVPARLSMAPGLVGFEAPDAMCEPRATDVCGRPFGTVLSRSSLARRADSRESLSTTVVEEKDNSSGAFPSVPAIEARSGDRLHSIESDRSRGLRCDLNHPWAASAATRRNSKPIRLNHTRQHVRIGIFHQVDTEEATSGRRFARNQSPSAVEKRIR